MTSAPASYYDEYADAFFDRTALDDVRHLHERFLTLLPPGGRVLDAGCGSGRDALAFSQAGFDAVAFDASAEMVRRAREHTGLPVQHLTFEEVAWAQAFDGVWANASLLHVPRSDLPRVVGRLVRALKPHGWLYASFKYGETERELEGRRFTDQTEVTLRELMRQAEVQVADVWIDADERPGHEGERWTCCIGRATLPDVADHA